MMMYENLTSFEEFGEIYKYLPIITRFKMINKNNFIPNLKDSLHQSNKGNYNSLVVPSSLFEFLN